jgi:hypothetical protein
MLFAELFDWNDPPLFKTPPAHQVLRHRAQHQLPAGDRLRRTPTTQTRRPGGVSVRPPRPLELSSAVKRGLSFADQANTPPHQLRPKT